jgi:hypothetical protein
MPTQADIDLARQYIADAQAKLTDADALLSDAPKPPTTGYHARTDTKAEPKPNPLALGPAPFRFTDPVFGSELLRFTDEHTVPDGTACRVPSNAHIAAWSSDGRRLYVMKATGGSQFFTWDGQQRTIDPTDVDRLVGLRGPKGTDPIDVKSYVEPSFSFDNPDVVVCGGGDNHRTVYAVDLRAGTTTVLCDLDVTYPWLPGRGETYMNALVTAHGAWTVAFGAGAQDLHDCVHFQRADGTWLGHSFMEWEPEGASQWQVHIHSVALDHSGRYVMVYTTAADIQAGKPKVIVWDTSNDTFAPVFQAQHFVSGHDCQGYGVSVNQDSQGQYDGMQWQKRALSDPTVSANVLAETLQPPKVYIEDHSNWRNVQPDNTQPYFSFTWRHDNDTTPWRAWDDEVLGVLPDGSAAYRFCHHQTIGGDQEFWDQCIGNVSPDGRWAMFTSNWGKTLPGARQDVFLVHLM